MIELPGWTVDPDAEPYWVDAQWGTAPRVGGAANRMIEDAEPAEGSARSWHTVQVGRVLEVEHLGGSHYRVLVHPYLDVPDLPPVPSEF